MQLQVVHGASASFQMSSSHYSLSALVMVLAESLRAIADELWQCPAPWQHMLAERSPLAAFGLHPSVEDSGAH